MSKWFSHIGLFGYEFHAPQWMWLLLLVPVFLVLRYFRLQKGGGVFKFSRSAKDLNEIAFSPIKVLIIGLYTLIGLGIAALILALAKPYSPLADDSEKEYGDGIDIVISMDVSGSMLATDFKPNRLVVAKQMAIEFVESRTSDYIGFVVFEGEAYTACPPTRDYEYLKKVIDETNTGLIEPGTAIGTGLGVAVTQLRSDTLASKVIILLTDGENNSGEISPMAAAQLAKNKNIKVYTIGIGAPGGIADIPVNTPFGVINQSTVVDFDEELLTKMAELTGGRYFNATNESSLREIYDQINKLETRQMVDTTIRKEMPYHPERFLLYGIMFLVLGLGLEQLLLKRYA